IRRRLLPGHASALRNGALVLPLADHLWIGTNRGPICASTRRYDQRGREDARGMLHRARAAYPRRCTSNANGLCGQNSAGILGIRASFQRDNLRRRFWVRVLHAQPASPREEEARVSSPSTLSLWHLPIERDRGQFVPSRRRRMMANVRAERLLKIPAEPSPELRIPGTAAPTRVVSMAGIRLGSWGRVMSGAALCRAAVSLCRVYPVQGLCEQRRSL